MKLARTARHLGPFGFGKARVQGGESWQVQLCKEEEEDSSQHCRRHCIANCAMSTAMRCRAQELLRRTQPCDVLRSSPRRFVQIAATPSSTNPTVASAAADSTAPGIYSRVMRKLVSPLAKPSQMPNSRFSAALSLFFRHPSLHRRTFIPAKAPSLASTAMPRALFLLFPPSNLSAVPPSESLSSTKKSPRPLPIPL